MMRILNEAGVEITKKSIDLTQGYIREEVIIRPDAIPVDDVTKFAYTDDDYETIQRYVTIPVEDRITKLKSRLAATDYVVIKIAEGAATAEEYAEIIAERRQLRAEINRLETE